MKLGTLELHVGELEALAVALLPYLDSARADSRWVSLDEYVALGFAPTEDAARKRIRRGQIDDTDVDKRGRRYFIRVPS